MAFFFYAKKARKKREKNAEKARKKRGKGAKKTSFFWKNARSGFFYRKKISFPGPLDSFICREAPLIILNYRRVRRLLH